MKTQVFVNRKYIYIVYFCYVFQVTKTCKKLIIISSINMCFVKINYYVAS